jgi:hypothetical protein
LIGTNVVLVVRLLLEEMLKDAGYEPFRSHHGSNETD